VAVSSSDIDFKWTIAPQLPSASAAAADASAAVGISSHYGILLGRMAGLPAAITDAALQIAERLEAKQRQRQAQQQGDSSMQRLRQVYSLVHKLGCVAREAAAQGLLPVDAAGRPVGDADAGVGGAGGGDGGSSSWQQVQLSRSMQMVRQLKQEADKLLLEAAREPVGA
jgi:hypothetical protein